MAEAKRPGIFKKNSYRPSLFSVLGLGFNPRTAFAAPASKRGSPPPSFAVPMPPVPPASADALPPTRARHWVVVFAGALAVITFVDRTCMSQAKVSIAGDLGLSSVQMGYVFAAFTTAYALFEIPGGWLGDLIGPRKVLIRVVLLWSFFTAATGRVWNLASLLVTQFLFGAGEAGAVPNLAKAFTQWLPVRERNRAVSIMWLCARWGGAITPLAVVWVISLVGWRWAFAVFAAPGVIWVAFFYRWFRDRPRDHPGVNAAELALIGEGREPAVQRPAVPWAVILRSRTVWLLFVQYFCFGYGWYFYITWLPTYVKEVRAVDLHKGALLSGLPLFFGGFACILSGWPAGWCGEAMGSPRCGGASPSWATAGPRCCCSCRRASPTRSGPWWPWASPASRWISRSRSAGGRPWTSGGSMRAPFPAP